MDNQQLLMFKGWFIDSYPECKDYLDLTYFDVEKSSFIAKCLYNPDSGIAAKVLRIAFGSWQHQQAKVEELETKLKQAYEDVDTFATAHEALEQRVDRDRSIIQFTQQANKDLIAERDELQKRVDAAKHYLGNIFTGDSFEDACHLKDLLDILDGKIVEEIEQALKGE